MNEEEKQDGKDKAKTSKHYSKFATVSFVLGLFSIMMMLYFWVNIFVDVTYRLYFVSGVSYNVLYQIVGILHILAFLSTFIALILGILAYSKMTYKEDRLSKILALCGIVLPLFYSALFSLQYTEWAGNYMVY